mgnify:FL=1|tara:strand:- start:29286 stop:30029 length:744 start_codon:yes stop_codon:yes gene_type:complete
MNEAEVQNSEETNEQVDNPTEEKIEVESRPEWLPEKFWTDNGQADYQGLAKSYSELESFVGKKNEEVEAQVIEKLEKEKKESLPEDATKYSIPEMPEGVNAENPLMDSWKDYCFKNSLNQDAFNAGIEMFMQNNLSMIPDVDKEMQILGENAKQRTDTVGLWVGKNFPQSEAQAIENLVNTADGVKALERIISMQKTTIGLNKDTITASKTRKDLEQMMLDPRYSNPAKRDATYVKEIDDAFAKMFG